MSITRYIPNLITLLNLFCGCIAVIYAVNNNFIMASFYVFLGIFFDFFDGFFARKLNVQSPLGVQLDSLADLVTSGVVPGIIMFKLLELSIDSTPYLSNLNSFQKTNWDNYQLPVIPLIGLLITLASAYRLAKFNLDTEQQHYFKGLPVPANTLLIIALPLILEFQNSAILNAIILNTWFLLLTTFLSCYLLNSNIKLFALKFKDYSFKNNAIRYIFLILCIVVLVVFHFVAIPLIILLYISLSLVSNKK